MPASGYHTLPLSNTPAFNHFPINRRITPSRTLCRIRSLRYLCTRVVKNSRKSTSSTQPPPIPKPEPDTSRLAASERGKLEQKVQHAASWAYWLGIVGAGLIVLVLVASVAMSEPLVEDLMFVDYLFNLATCGLSIYWGHKIRKEREKRVRRLTFVIILYSFKMLVALAQPPRLAVLIWAMIAFVKGRKAAKKLEDSNKTPAPVPLKAAPGASSSVR